MLSNKKFANWFRCCWIASISLQLILFAKERWTDYYLSLPYQLNTNRRIHSHNSVKSVSASDYAFQTTILRESVTVHRKLWRYYWFSGLQIVAHLRAMPAKNKKPTLFFWKKNIENIFLGVFWKCNIFLWPVNLPSIR